MGKVIPFNPEGRRKQLSDTKSEVWDSASENSNESKVDHKKAVEELCKMMKLEQDFANLVNTCKLEYNKYLAAEEKEKLKSSNLNDLIELANNRFKHNEFRKKPAFTMGLYYAIYELTFPTNK